MRTCDRANAVERVAHIGHPVAQGLVHRILERGCSGGYGNHLGTEQLHAEDVRLLPGDIRFSHIDDARQPEAGANRGRCDTMLTRSGLRDDSGLPHSSGEKDLAEDIVDLVGTGMIEFVAFEVHPCAAQRLRYALRKVEWRWPSDIIAKELVHFRPIGGILPGKAICRFEFEDGRHQRFGHEASAELAEATTRVGAAAKGIRCKSDHGVLPCGAWELGMAARRNAAIRSGSLWPGEASTPEDTST